MIAYDPSWIARVTAVLKRFGFNAVDDDVKKVQAARKKSQAVLPSSQCLQLAHTYESRVAADPDDPSDSSKQYHLHPLIRDDADTTTVHVWLGLKIRFEWDNRNYNVHHMQLLLFRGEQTQRALLRAEWDARENIGDTHSQPHWHVYPGSPNGQLAVDPVDQDWIERVHRMHLAMCAQWHATSGARANCHSPRLDSGDDLVEWMTQVLEYTTNQLRYALKKVPIDQAPSLGESTHVMVTLGQL